MDGEVATKEKKELFEEVTNEENGVLSEQGEGGIATDRAELVEVHTVRVEELNEISEPAKKPKRGERIKAILREHFSAPRIAYMAVFTALAFVVTLLEFPIFPQASFLKLDFANVFFMFEGFIFGPVEAIVSIGIKELLCWSKSSSGGVGELANFIMSTAYIIIPSVVYRFKRGKRWVCFYLVCACIMQIGISLFVNCYVNFPYFMGEPIFVGGPVSSSMFAKLWTFVLYFNIIKSVAVSVVVFLIYKPLSRFIKMTTDKFDKRMKRAKQKREEQKTQEENPQA